MNWHMWRLGYKTTRIKPPNNPFWEYTYVIGGLEKVYERMEELHNELKTNKFSVEWKEEREE